MTAQSEPVAFIYEQQGRSKKLILVLIAIYTGLAALMILIDLAPWIAGILALTTLPAIYDLIANPKHTLCIDQDGISWATGRFTRCVNRHEIDRMVLNTRLDFTVKTTIYLKNHPRIRLPGPVIPPPEALETALKDHNYPFERHHFAPFR